MTIKIYVELNPVAQIPRRLGIVNAYMRQRVRATVYV